MGARKPTEEELHAFVDDELPAARRADIETILLEEQALSVRVAAYRGDRDDLRKALRGIEAEPLPAVWAEQIEAAMATKLTSPARVRSPRWAAPRYAIAAGLALAVVAGIATRLAWPTAQTIVTAAAAARDGTIEGHFQTPLPEADARNALLQTAIGLRVRAPDLHRFGFQLVALETFGPAGAGAAELRYKDAKARDLTIYIRPSDGTVRFDILKQGSIRVCVWQDDVVGTVIMADMSAGEMMRVASSAYGDLNL